MKKFTQILVVFAILPFVMGFLFVGPSVKNVEKQFRATFLCAFGCPVRECNVVKQANDTFAIDYTYRQCPICLTDINFADNPCRGHAPQLRRGRARAHVGSGGRLRFFLANGREFDSWGIK
ncbi:MAG: hypothetical protein IKO40_12320 [Kiritimatiellae bacterium]|nr:hypothetical protein [Kiritimatiellia bacterium]